jgi:hypothetical protein
MVIDDARLIAIINGDDPENSNEEHFLVGLTSARDGLLLGDVLHAESEVLEQSESLELLHFMLGYAAGQKEQWLEIYGEQNKTDGNFH